MARVRPAQRCTARRSEDGQPCEAFAIHGGFVCMAHGGAAPAVQAAAELRLVKAEIQRSMRASDRRWQQEMQAWHADRIATTSRLMGVPPAQVTRGLIVVCHIRHGVPPLDDEAPQPRIDRRYGRRLAQPYHPIGGERA